MAAVRSRALPVFLATAVLGLAGSGLRGTAQEGPKLIPGSGDGYSISQPSETRKAPTGFVGQTDTSTLTAVGNTPATMGKRVVARFKLFNQIQTCPDRDGTVEGEGEYSVTVDSTDEKTNTSLHVAMQAKAQYKGQVNDEAYLEGPVKAEIDYTYTTTMRDTSGALLTPAGTNVVQHVTIPFVVSPGMSSPSFGAFSGGDPSRGQLSDAFTAGMALAYWAGIYYSEAQHKWRDGLCAEFSFDPPSRTVEPPPRTEVKVKAQVRSKRGEIVKAHFQEVRAFAGGSVDPPGGWSSDTVPLTFTYMAGTQKAANAGFEVLATSRVGIARIPSWNATLGTDWSGEITCSYSAEGGGSSEQQTGSYSSARQYTVEVKDGGGRARGYSDQRGSSRTLRPVARQGYVFDRSQRLSAIAQGERDARVNVELNSVKGTYQIKVEHRSFDLGRSELEYCDRRNGCRQESLDYGVEPCPPVPAGLYGEFGNPNELRGSVSDVRTGSSGQASSQRWTLTWHLARRGTTR